MTTSLHRLMASAAFVLSIAVTNAFGQQNYDFTAQGQRFHDARIESIGNDGRVFIRHAGGTTAVHGSLVPKQLYDAYYAALEAAKKPKDSFEITAKIIQIQDEGALANISIEHSVERTREREVPGGTMLDGPHTITRSTQTLS
jgi:hypothetical protein